MMDEHSHQAFFGERCVGGICKYDVILNRYSKNLASSGELLRDRNIFLA